MSSWSVTSTTTEPPRFATTTCCPGSVTSTNVTSSTSAQLIERGSNCRHPWPKFGRRLLEIAARDEVYSHGNKHSGSDHVNVMNLGLFFDDFHLNHAFAAN